MPDSRARKQKWTVTIAPEIEKQVESFLKKHKQEKITRSAIVEEAMELWLAKQNEVDEERYFQAHAAELNADSKSWSRITTEAAKHIWKAEKDERQQQFPL